MTPMQLAKQPLVGLSLLRSLNYLVEYQSLQAIGLLLSRLAVQSDIRPLRFSAEGLANLANEMRALFSADVDLVTSGKVPAQVLWSESPLRHARRIPQVLFDGFRIGIRRHQKKSKEFTSEAQDRLAELPDYYRRNFHFQTDGYLTERSAELYDHQVELLFLGAADAMRRIVLATLINEYGDGQGRSFVEVGCGTGAMTRNIRLALPKARILATDLSDPYLKVAKRRLADFDRIDFMQADACHMPLQDGQYDLVYSVFLFHEMPRQVRTEVVREAHRLLKPGGLFVFVDSIQLGDKSQFDDILRRFPVDFHEPFYLNYIESPMADLIEAEGFEREASRLGFLAKGEVFRKTEI